MSLTVSGELLKATSSAQLAKYRKSAKESRIDREMLVNTNELGDEGLKDLEVAAQEVGDKKTARAVESIRAARGGNFDKPVSSFKAFRDVLESFLLANSIDGWIYVCGDDGKLYPELVTGVSFDDGLGYGRGKGDPSIKLHTTSYGFSRDGNYKVQFGLASAAHTFSPRNVSNRRVADILAEAGLLRKPVSCGMITRRPWRDTVMWRWMPSRSSFASTAGSFISSMTTICDEASPCQGAR